MMTTAAPRPSGIRTLDTAIGRSVRDALAQPLHGAGACLILLRSDGSLLHHDPHAGVFHERYVVPALQHAELFAAELQQRVSSLMPADPTQIWDFVPGALLALIPYVERKQIIGFLGVAARRRDLALNEDMLRVCGSLGIDATWLNDQAQQLPGFDSDRMQTLAGMLQTMARDKVRLSSMEEELTSLSTQLANTYEELTLIDQISGGMRVNRRTSEFFRQACLDVIQVVNIRGVGVALVPTDEPQPPVLYGEVSLPPGHVQRLADDLLPLMRNRKNCLLINDLSKDKNLGWLGEWARHLIAVPLQCQDQVLGCLFGIDKSAGEFDSVDAKLLTSIANECAIYLENAYLYGDVHDLMMGMLHSLTSAIDAKDAYTCGHSERVALLARYMAQQLKLPDGQVEQVYMAGLLHDVGKIGVPEAVLQKTGRLTQEEFELMKKHPQVGARILADVKQMEKVVPGVLHHHERFDGAGYPAGLAGEAIPIAGRIICLADSVDAMTSNRTYRIALPVETAMNEVRRCAGSQFDPVVAEVLLRTTPEQFRAILHDHEVKSQRLLELQEALRAA